jgi:hypothetical protein
VVAHLWSRIEIKKGPVLRKLDLSSRQLWRKTMNPRNTTSLLIAFAALALATILLSACSLDRRASVEDGTYTVLHGGAVRYLAVAREIHSLEIDRDQNLMTLTLRDGSQIVASFVPRNRKDWPDGCPTNIYSTRMEVLDVEQDPLTIGQATINQPVLVRDCPSEPVRLVLRSDGAIGGASTACPHPQPCIYFAP